MQSCKSEMIYKRHAFIRGRLLRLTPKAVEGAAYEEITSP